MTKSKKVRKEKKVSVAINNYKKEKRKGTLNKLRSIEELFTYKSRYHVSKGYDTEILLKPI